jgi:hypothetical protein
MAATLQQVQDAGVTNPESLAGILSDADLLSLMEQAQDAPEPGAAGLGLTPEGKNTKNPRDVIFRGDPDAPETLMMATALQSAGYKRVYHRFTGEVSIISRNNLPQVLKKRDEQDRQVFTTTKPNITPIRGKVKCLLHVDMRTEEMVGMGLPECPKSNLTSAYQQRLHMQHRHKSAWEALEEAKKLEREQEERDSRLAILQLAQGAPGRVSAPRPSAAPAPTEDVGGEAPVKPARTPAQIAHAERLAQQSRDRAAAARAAQQEAA